MRTVIQQLVATELEAGRLVAAARAEADAILGEARQAAAVLGRQSREDTGVAAAEMRRTATEAAERERADRLKQADEQSIAVVEFDPARRSQVVAAAVRCVCGATAVKPPMLIGHPVQRGPPW
jgi:vacuolar-type H+-ATPase subunit H